MLKKKSTITSKDIINIFGKNVISSKNPDVSGVTIIDGKNTFPVSWIQKQGYCEYQLYIEHFKKIKAKPTIEMITGSKEHHRLEKEFKEKAEESSFEEMLDISTQTSVYSREFPVVSLKYGIHGLIDEIRMSPNSFFIIDDKPGQKVYKANAYQVYAYCLAFKDMTYNEFPRNIYAGLRERGTDNIYWQDFFNQDIEEEIIKTVERVHKLILGQIDFIATTNPNKCLKCRFNRVCDRKI